jgi:parvulin-like peptidyl-prolyl isomerase
MMQSLRKNTRWVLVIVLAGFAGLIFFQWGLDVTGIRQRPETDVAVIDGEVISYQEYRRFLAQKESENKSFTSDQIWSMLVEEVMWRKLQQKERIGVNDDEILAVIRNNPPSELYESEYMRNEKGEFDWNKYAELLKSPQSLQWLYQYEMQLREVLPKEKLRSLMSTLAWVSPFDDSLTMQEQTVKYDLTFLNVQLGRLRNSVKVSDEDLKVHYEEHKSEFATPEYVILDYVFFERKPSSYDTLDARQQLEDFVAMVQEGEDFLELGKEVSDDTTVEYKFSNADIMKPYMRSVYDDLKNGEISGIVSATGGFEVMKRVGPGLLYVVKANIEVSPTTLGEITDNIAAFKEAAEDYGFDSAAADYKLAVRMTFPLDKEKPNFPVRSADALAGFLKDVKKDLIGGPFSSLGGYYVFALDSVIPAAQPSYEEAAARVRATVERKAYEDALVDFLNDVHGQIASGKTMEALAESDNIINLQKDVKDQTIYSMRSTYGDNFAGTVAALQPGQISAPVISRYMGYIIRLDAKHEVPFDSTMLGMLQWKRQIQLQQITQSIFTPEKLVDNRDAFFE